MITLSFSRKLRHVVCLGAHPDDIEIGAAGLVSRLSRKCPEATFTFVVASGSESRIVEAQQSLRSLLGDRGKLVTGGFRDGFVPYTDSGAVKEFMRQAVEGALVDLVVSPRVSDAHQDHSIVARFARQLFRDHTILEYEIAKYDADLGRPTVYLALSIDEVNAKLEHLANHFGSQHENAWYDGDAFRSLMRVRGIECNSQSGFAEAFETWKLSITGSH